MSGEGESIADIQPALSSLELAYQVVREAGGNMTSYSQSGRISDWRQTLSISTVERNRTFDCLLFCFILTFKMSLIVKEIS